MNQLIPPHVDAATLSGWFYVPYSALGGERGVREEKGLLTIKSPYAEDIDEPIRMYKDIPSRALLGIPRAYALERFPWLSYTDKRTFGEDILPTPKRPDPNHPAVKEPERQKKFILALHDAARAHGSFMAQAATGSGKTVCALDAAAEMGRKTLVLVHLERLRDQWLDEIKDKLGVPEARIGIVQGPTCEYIGKDFVVGLMPSLSQRKDYPRDFYQSFGTVIVDEVHRVGTPLLSKCVPLFPAYYRWGFSATIKRRDGMDKVAFNHIGPLRVTSKATALACSVYVKRYKTQRKLWGNSPIQRAKCLASDPDRNAMLVDLIRRNYAVGRNMLIIGKYVDHLQDLMEECIRQGVPQTACGQFTGEKLQRQWTNTNNGWRLVTTKRIKVKKEEFDHIKKHSQLIFATYGMFKEGIDVPRLDCGIDVLPQSEATQVIGRIRRPLEGKPQPYWITPLDVSCPISRRMFDKRRVDYHTTGCRIVESQKI
jgi:superfamily II DNA or RNA helicase